MELRPDVFCCDLFLQLQFDKWSRHEFFVVTMLVISSENSGCDLLFLVSKNWCRDLTLFAFTTCLCRDLDLMLRHHFYCHPICFLVVTFFFRLRHLSVVLSLQAGRDSTLLVCLFSCRDVLIKLRQSSFFNQCNSCRDLKSMS